MSEERDILLHLRRAKQDIKHAEELLIKDGLTPVRKFRDYVLSATASLETAELIIRGEGRERG